MKFFPGQLFCYRYDKAVTAPMPVIGYEYDEKKFKELNDKSNGIFVTFNSFKDSTRLQKNLIAINAIAFDIDFAKEKDSVKINLEELELKRSEAVNSIKFNLCPSQIVFTKHGFHPYWFIKEPIIITDKNRNDYIVRYHRLAAAMIEWSKQFDNRGDTTSDCNRVLRLPGFYHHKGEPYLISHEESYENRYSFEELEENFKDYYEKSEKLSDWKEIKDYADEIEREISKLDIKQVVSEFWKETGHTVSWNKYSHLILDGIATATFADRQGRNFIATTSGEYPYKGPAIHYIWQAMKGEGIKPDAVYEDAKQWVASKFNIEDKRNPEYVELKKWCYGKHKMMGHYKIAQYLVNKYNIKTLGGERHKELYIYDDGIYSLKATAILRGEIQDILDELATTNVKNEVLEKIKDFTFTEREEFKIDRNLINLKNGVLNIKEKKLLPHSPDYLFLHQIPVNYNPKENCEGIKKFLLDIIDEKDISTIQEWFGYALYRQYFIKKALILYGEGNTGKTTFLRILTKFVGGNNVAGISLQKIGTDKFAAAHLYEKHLNIYDDLSFNDVTDNGAFKMTTGGGYITGEYKFGDQFIFENYAKLTFSCNKIPSPKDIDDNAYFARWIIVQFKRVVSPDKIDKFLLERLLNDEELSGLLNWALEGLYRLLENQDFSYGDDIYANKMEMLKSSSTIARFTYECIKQVAEEWISKDGLYKAYTDFCTENELAIETKDKFGKDIAKFSGYIVDGKKIDPVTEKQVTGWRNVSLVKQEKVVLPELPVEVDINKIF